VWRVTCWSARKCPAPSLPVFIWPLPSKSLADATGSVREVVARALRELRREGAVATADDGITVLDPGRPVSTGGCCDLSRHAPRSGSLQTATSRASRSVDGFSGAAAHSILAQISGELAGTAPDVQSILTSLTRSLSRIRSGTWFAVLLDPDPSTSHVVVAGDSDGSMSAYVDGFREDAGPDRTGTPTSPCRSRSSRRPTPSDSQCALHRLHLAAVACRPELLLEPSSSARAGCCRRAGGPDACGRRDHRPRSESSTAAGNQRCPRTTSYVCSWLPIMWLWRWRTRGFRRRVGPGRAGRGHRRHRTGDQVGQDLPLTLRVVVEQVTARLNVDAADVLLMTEQGNELYVAASAGFHTSSIPSYGCRPARGRQEPPTGGRTSSTPGIRTGWLRIHGAPFCEGGISRPTWACRSTPAAGSSACWRSTTAQPLVGTKASLDFLDTLGGIAAVAIDYAAASAGAGEGERSVRRPPGWATSRWRSCARSSRARPTARSQSKSTAARTRSSSM